MSANPYETDLDRNPANYQPLTPLAHLERAALIHPDHVAIIHGNLRMSYGVFLQRSKRLANALTGLGVCKGETVSVMLSNTPAMLEAHHGVPMTGAVLHSINTRLDAQAIAFQLDHAECRILIVDREFSGVVAEALSLAQVRPVVIDYDDPEYPGDAPFPKGDRIGSHDYEEFVLAGSADFARTAPADEWEAVSLNYTSGTTGNPKGVVYHHRGAALMGYSNVIASGMGRHPVYLWTLPMFHCNGWSFPWAVTAVGATHVCLRRCLPKEMFHLIEKESVSHLCASPNILLMMICFPEAPAVRLRRPLQVLTAGASPSPVIIQGMEDIGADITHVYGLTELHGPHSVCAWQAPWVELDPESVAKMKARQGVASITSLHMAVVDSQSMEPVPHDGRTVGEVVMRGHNVMAGYYKDAAATDLAFRGGWFHSGDLGVIHADGYLQITDRASDVIVRGGDMISSIEIEEIIYQHPDVLEVAVVSTPDPVWGEVPKAFVVPKRGRTPTEEEIIEFCRSHHAQFKAPKTVEFGQLPKTATGKTIKAKLRSREWFGMERKVS